MTSNDEACDQFFEVAGGPYGGAVPASVIAQANKHGKARAAENPGLDVPALLRAFAAMLDQPTELPAGWFTRARLRAKLRVARRADRAFWSAPPAAQAHALNWYLGMGESLSNVLEAAGILNANERSQGRHSSVAITLHAWRNGVDSPGRQLTDIATKDCGGWGSISLQAKYTRSALSLWRFR